MTSVVRIEVYRDHLFRQARWEVELLKMDLGTAELMPLLGRAVSSSERAVTTLDGLAPAFTKAADTVATSAVVIAAERQAALVGLQNIVAQMLRFAEGERRATLDQVTEERVAALDQMGVKLTEIVGEFRTIAVTERTALSRDIEVAGTRIVDHAAWRMAQLLAALLAALFVGTALLLVVARKLFAA